MIRKKQENRKNDVTILAENRGKIAAPHGDLSSHVALRKSGFNTGFVWLPSISPGRSLAKNRKNRGLLLIRNEMAIAFSHLLSLVSHPGIDQPLIDALGGTIRGKGMPLMPISA